MSRMVIGDHWAPAYGTYVGLLNRRDLNGNQHQRQQAVATWRGDWHWEANGVGTMSNDGNVWQDTRRQLGADSQKPSATDVL